MSETQTEDRKHSIYFGEELTARRKELGLNRMQVAEKAGLTYNIVARLEKGLKVKPVEYRALCEALELPDLTPDANEAPTVDGESWGGLHRGDPVILADRPDVEYEFRRYNPPEARGGEYVEVVEIEGKFVRQTRTADKRLVCRYTGVGVDTSDDAEAFRKAIADRFEAQKARNKEAAMLRQQHLNEVE